MTLERGMMLAACLALAGCESTLPYAYLTSELSAAPRIVTLGEEVELEVAATNWGDETVHADNGCGPGLGFMITRPDQERVNPYPASWPCEAEDSQVLEPGETDVVVFRWRPPLAGSYSVVGGFVVGDRLWSISEDVGFEVRAP
jgi:hypothetical protein